jgi:hypothetical protein
MRESNSLARAAAAQTDEPDDVHPHGHVPLLGLAIASCAPWLGTQYDPLDV